MFNSITLKIKHGPSSTQLRDDFVFPSTRVPVLLGPTSPVTYELNG